MKIGPRQVYRDCKVLKLYTEPQRFEEFKDGEEINVPFGQRKSGAYTVEGRGIFSAKAIRGFSRGARNI